MLAEEPKPWSCGILLAIVISNPELKTSFLRDSADKDIEGIVKYCEKDVSVLIDVIKKLIELK